MGERPAHSCDILHVVFKMAPMALGTEERGVVSFKPRFVFTMHYGSTLGAKAVFGEGTDGVVVIALVVLSHKGMAMGTLATYLAGVSAMHEADDMLTMTTILTVNCAGTRYMLEA